MPLFLDLKRGNYNPSHLVPHAIISPHVPLMILTAPYPRESHKASQISKEHLVVKQPITGFDVALSIQAQKPDKIHPCPGICISVFHFLRGICMNDRVV